MTDRDRAYLAAIARAYQLAPDGAAHRPEQGDEITPEFLAAEAAAEEEGALERVWCDVCARLRVPHDEQEAIMEAAGDQLRREGFFT